jgi:diguanylate cyclase
MSLPPSSAPSSSAAPAAAANSPATLAKGALRRLALAKLEPTPANFARAYAEEAGEPAAAEHALPARHRPVIDRLAARCTDDPGLRTELGATLMAGRLDELPRLLERQAGAAVVQARQWAELVERLARGLERGSRHWTGGRKKDSLQRVLDACRSDGPRLQSRLRTLLSTWEADAPDEPVEAAEGGDATVGADGPSGAATPTAVTALTAPAEPPSGPAAGTGHAAELRAAAVPGHHPRIVEALATTVRAGLAPQEPRARELADELAALAERIAREGATISLAEGVAEVCQRVRCLYGLRHELVDELLGLCRTLTDGMAELAEDGSWAQGQAAALRQRLDGPQGARAVRAARALLSDTRERQRTLASQRAQARDALKQVIGQMLTEIGTLDEATGTFNTQVLAHADTVQAADTLESLAEAVRQMVQDSHAVHAVVHAARERLSAEHGRATALESQVRGLEAELRQLSEEVGTDALTQVANRRGLGKVFEVERARVEREGVEAAPLAVGLLDIDNFKKLNDTLGHAAGDEALKSLAARVKEWLRPIDHVARFGGEEFVVLLPATPVDEAQAALTRLQRRLSAALFMHDGREVFVTFSAGVTAWRPGEALEVALERADEGLYEAKRTGKNRTCIT